MRSYGGFDELVDLSIAGLPSGVTTTWSADPVDAIADGDATSRVNLRVSSTATTGTCNLAVTGTAGEFARTVRFSLLVR